MVCRSSQSLRLFVQTEIVLKISPNFTVHRLSVHICMSVSDNIIVQKDNAINYLFKREAQPVRLHQRYERNNTPLAVFLLKLEELCHENTWQSFLINAANK